MGLLLLRMPVRSKSALGNARKRFFSHCCRGRRFGRKYAESLWDSKNVTAWKSDNQDNIRKASIIFERVLHATASAQEDGGRALIVFIRAELS
jgi:hypothetical protein